MRILTRDDELRELSRDSGIIELRPAEAFVASTEADVLEAIETAKKKMLPLTPRGSGTGIPSQAVGRGIILLQERRRAVFAGGESVECEPAQLKGDLNRFLDSRSRWLPVDPSSYATCSVGGMVSNNSSGSRSYKYGSTIDYVEELRAVFPEEGLVEVKPMPIDLALSMPGPIGRVAKLLLDNKDAIARDAPQVTKNSSGYRLEEVVRDNTFDLPRLFVGSEGTLCVVTAIKFRTRPRPKTKVLLIFETSLKRLDRLVAALRAHGPSAIELLDKAIFEQTGRGDRIKSISRTGEPYLVFAEFDSESDTVESLDDVAADAAIAGYEPVTLVDPGDVSKAWDVRNETLTIAADMKKGSRSPVPGVEDVVVPPARLGELIKLQVGEFEKRGLEYISYGHAGDANLHMRPLLDSRSASDMRVLREIMTESFEAVWKMGGSITGEHGDGMLRAEFVSRQYPHSYHVMREVKRLFDPKGMLNPGVKIV